MKYEITKEQVLHIEKTATYAVSRELKEWFPEYFELPKDFTGWVKEIKYPNFLAYSKDGIIIYGFDVDKKWVSDINTRLRNETEATESEVFEALKAEWKRLGGGEGIYFESPVNKINGTDNGAYNFRKNKMFSNGLSVFNDGKWAEIIPTITKEEAEKSIM